MYAYPIRKFASGFAELTQPPAQRRFAGCYAFNSVLE